MTPGKRGIGTIAVDLQDAGKACEMRLGALGLAIASVDIGDHRRITATPWPVIAGIGPDLAGLGLLPTRLEHGAVVSSANSRSDRRNRSRIWLRKGRKYLGALPTQSARVERSSWMP
jgi:hypothetical protein